MYIFIYTISVMHYNCFATLYTLNNTFPWFPIISHSYVLTKIRFPNHGCIDI